MTTRPIGGRWTWQSTWPGPPGAATTSGRGSSWTSGRSIRERCSSGLRPPSRRWTLVWDDLPTIRSWSPLKLVLKGVLTAEDATLAVEHGADAIVVSNHGARQLDRTVAPIDALAEIVAAVGGRTEVWVDGGVRRGLDIAIALALGARGVLVGRPMLWALAAGGQAGVERALEILREEFEIALALLGTPTPRDITRAHVTR